MLFDGYCYIGLLFGVTVFIIPFTIGDGESMKPIDDLLLTLSTYWSLENPPDIIVWLKSFFFLESVSFYIRKASCLMRFIISRVSLCVFASLFISVKDRS